MQGLNLTLKSTEATHKMKNQLTISLSALFPYNNV